MTRMGRIRINKAGRLLEKAALSYPQLSWPHVMRPSIITVQRLGILFLDGRGEPGHDNRAPIKTAPALARMAAGLGAALGLSAALLLGPGLPAQGGALAAAEPSAGAEPSVELSESQRKAIKTEAAGFRTFPQELNAAGTIDFNQELLTQIFTPYQGRILKAYPSVGDRVEKDQTLFTIDSPDLVQAESTLIAAAGVLELTSRVLERQKNLYKQNAAAQKDFEQAVSDQQAAEGAYRAARAAVKVFGKSEGQIDNIVSSRTIDPALVVPSPIAGLITARTAAPGLLVQPGSPPPVYIVADMATLWMLAQVPEKDAPKLKGGQEVKAQVSALPGHLFLGRIVTVGASLDPNTRRVLVRSEIADPGRELRAGMFASFTITLAPPKRALAVSQDSIVREGDGAMTVWIAAGANTFVKRTVKMGLLHDGFAEIEEGLKEGELIATGGALFIANHYTNAGH
jgi:membrane fusion protein, heavy metal efflux system